MNKSVNGILINGYRAYQSYGMKLLSWRQRRCVICQRFLFKDADKYCEKHGVGSKEYSLYNKDKIHEYCRIWRTKNHAYDINRHRVYYRRLRGIKAWLKVFRLEVDSILILTPYFNIKV